MGLELPNDGTFECLTMWSFWLTFRHAEERASSYTVLEAAVSYSVEGFQNAAQNELDNYVNVIIYFNSYLREELKLALSPMHS
jgi:hypothetical protein